VTYRIGHRCRVHKPGSWLDGQEGAVLDVAGSGREACVAVEFDRLEHDGRRRVFIFRARELWKLGTRSYREVSDERNG
jgi:hypothetical protein